LRTRGFVIYLCASVPDLVARLRDDRKRPLLKGQDPRVTLETLLAEREPFYKEVADLVVETGRPNVTRLTGVILDALLAMPAEALSTPTVLGERSGETQ
jgi:3-dehydroquinate synthase